MDKIRLDQVAIEWSGQTVKKLTVILTGDQTISTVLRTPAVWCQVQTSDSDKVLRVRDEVELVSRDGLSFTVGVRVLQTKHDGRVYLCQPLRTETWPTRDCMPTARMKRFGLAAGSPSKI